MFPFSDQMQIFCLKINLFLLPKNKREIEFHLVPFLSRKSCVIWEMQ